MLFSWNDWENYNVWNTRHLLVPVVGEKDGLILN